ncbi:LysR substrate-binding domain-containing protein [Nonomuraea thailandensis]
MPARGEVTGTIRVAAFRSAAFHLLPGVLVRFGQRYPKMTVTVRIVPDLGRGRGGGGGRARRGGDGDGGARTRRGDRAQAVHGGRACQDRDGRARRRCAAAPRGPCDHAGAGRPPIPEHHDNGATPLAHRERRPIDQRPPAVRAL